MTIELKLRKIGNSTGVVLPKEALARLHVAEGDVLYLTEAPDNTLRLSSRHSGPVALGRLQHLRTGKSEAVALAQGGVREGRPGDYVVSGRVDFDDVSYDDQADLLHDLAGQVVRECTGLQAADRR